MSTSTWFILYYCPVKLECWGDGITDLDYLISEIQRLVKIENNEIPKDNDIIGFLMDLEWGKISPFPEKWLDKYYKIVRCY